MESSLQGGVPQTRFSGNNSFRPQVVKGGSGTLGTRKNLYHL